jgi:hypothetical protein
LHHDQIVAGVVEDSSIKRLNRTLHGRLFRCGTNHAAFDETVMIPAHKADREPVPMRGRRVSALPTTQGRPFDKPVPNCTRVT